jgi:hypothetical protein
MKIVKIARELDAWELGAGTDTEARLLREEKLRRLPDGTYLVFSRETDAQGQIAQAGDYIKIDSAGFPYPNRRNYFLDNHIPLGDCRYRQKTPVLDAWTREEPMPPAVRFLLDTGLLRIDEQAPAHYFRAFLWDAELFAARDAVVVLDRVTRDENGEITGVDFHFIARQEFEITHKIVE